MFVTKENAKAEYDSLTNAQKKNVQGIMMTTRKQYAMFGIQVDVPYYFWQVNKPLFDDGEAEVFIAIDSSREFVEGAIFLISRYMRRMSNEGKEEKEGS